MKKPISTTTDSIVEQLKASISFAALLRSDGVQLTTKGVRLAACCPFHADSTPSFYVTKDDSRGKCFGCGWSGSIFDYVMEKRSCTFIDALEFLDKAKSLHGTRNVSVPSEQKPEEHFAFSDQQKADIQKYTSALSNDARAKQQAEHREWSGETFKKLAKSGHLGSTTDALAFIYSSGVKVRKWPGKDIFWECGGPSIWRSDVLVDAETVYLTEGETDAIELIDSGIEEPGVAIVAAPSATTFNKAWAELFRGKDVIICFDNDEAGKRGSTAVADALTGVAKSVRVWVPKEEQK